MTVLKDLFSQLNVKHKKILEDSLAEAVENIFKTSMTAAFQDEIDTKSIRTFLDMLDESRSINLRDLLQEAAPLFIINNQQHEVNTGILIGETLQNLIVIDEYANLSSAIENFGNFQEESEEEFEEEPSIPLHLGEILPTNKEIIPLKDTRSSRQIKEDYLENINLVDGEETNFNVVPNNLNKENDFEAEIENEVETQLSPPTSEINLLFPFFKFSSKGYVAINESMLCVNIFLYSFSNLYNAHSSYELKLRFTELITEIDPDVDARFKTFITKEPRSGTFFEAARKRALREEYIQRTTLNGTTYSLTEKGVNQVPGRKEEKTFLKNIEAAYESGNGNKGVIAA